MYRISACLFLLIVAACPPGQLSAQGPRPSYYYRSELAWADASIYMPSGSTQPLAFLPVINREKALAPLAAGSYERDIDVDGPVVFVGAGQETDYTGRRADFSEGPIDVEGKVVFACYDFPGPSEESRPAVEGIISVAAKRGSVGVVLFSFEREYPFERVDYDGAAAHPIPAITVTLDSALSLFEAAGYDGHSIIDEWQASGSTLSMALAVNLAWKIDSAFERIETDNFLYRFRGQAVPLDEMEKIAELNERSLAFIKKTFAAADAREWKKDLNVYFRFFDTKTYFTRHWGFGLASDQGVYNVIDGVPDYGLIVHENTHQYTRINLGETSSFMTEGLAGFTEALATEVEKNHEEVRGFIENGSMLPLEELIYHEIGMPGAKTRVGYPASGSFMAFLIQRYGYDAVKKTYILESRAIEDRDADSSWTQAFGKSIAELEREWLDWLKETTN